MVLLYGKTNCEIWYLFKIFPYLQPEYHKIKELWPEFVR